MVEMTPKDHPSFKLDPDYSWDKIPKNSFDVPNQKMEVPDWRIYKVEGIKELEYVRDTLASKGLKDPWLRNEVWRYPPFWERNILTTYGKYLWGKNLKSLKYGLGIATTICTLQYLYYKNKYGGYPPHVTTMYRLLFGGGGHH